MILSTASALNLVKAKILSFGKELTYVDQDQTVLECVFTKDFTKCLSGQTDNVDQDQTALECVFTKHS